MKFDHKSISPQVKNDMRKLSIIFIIFPATLQCTSSFTVSAHMRVISSQMVVIIFLWFIYQILLKHFTFFWKNENREYINWKFCETILVNYLPPSCTILRKKLNFFRALIFVRGRFLDYNNNVTKATLSNSVHLSFFRILKLDYPIKAN